MARKEEAVGLLIGVALGAALASCLWAYRENAVIASVMPKSITRFRPVSARDSAPPQVREVRVPMKDEAPGTRYNCDLSAGTFSDGKCTCSIEEFQTQEQMYDRDTGFCQSTIGGPAGRAGWSYVGLPEGDYAYYQEIIMHDCERSGGTFLWVCNCPEGKTYDKKTGTCSSSE